MAKSTYEVPAQQRTARELEKSRRHYASWVGGSLVAAGAMFASAGGWLGTPLAWVLVAIVGIFGAREIVQSVVDRAKDSVKG